jgi:signal transduction histidine kinase
VLKLIIEKMAVMMEAEICMLFLKDDSGERVTLQEAFGLKAGMLTDAFYELGEGVTGTVAQTGVPRLISKAVKNNGKYDAEIREYLSQKHGEPTTIESLMVVPIQRRDEILGAMKVINKVGNQPQYTTDDLSNFVTFADYVDVAIFNAQEYKDAMERLTVAERNSALSQLVRAVAHEINNTFGTISATVEGVRARLGPTTPDIERMLSRIDDAATQTTEFATEISGYSAGRAGAKEARDVNKIILAAVSAINHAQYDVWGFITVEEDYCDNPLICEVYANPFSQVVRNIVINALQAMAERPGGRLWITTDAGSGEFEGKAIVRFRDNGPGIRPEYLPSRIFEPDFTTKASGNGVGLWLVHSQLQLIGATIAVESVYGQGAVFTLLIPLVDRRPPS